jgi:hypothetical protein
MLKTRKFIEEDIEISTDYDDFVTRMIEHRRFPVRKTPNLDVIFIKVQQAIKLNKNRKAAVDVLDHSKNVAPDPNCS